MYLILDLGNTNKKMAVLPSGKLTPEAFSITTGKIESYPEISLQDVREFSLRYPAIDACILSSVIPYPVMISDWLRKRFRYLEFNHKTPLPITNRYLSPETLGRDRLASAIAGFSMYPGQDVLVINAGTALTYDLVTSAGAYIGGSISPGMNMRFRALHTFTGQLPLLTYTEIDFLTGTDTEGSLLSGVINGMTAEMERMIQYYQEEYPGIKVILSGGDLIYFVNRLKISIFALPNIVIYGLQQILAFNDKESF
ncbi:MAG: type III pantothenate kinase [Bacteroidetes bacterium]|nr:type III pantothenate kinase [Bacteroidota bacterium]